MPCQVYGNAIICSPTIDVRKLDFGWCSTCGGRRVMWWEHAEWYGWDWTCLVCGERWADGERMERPFMPRWRQKSIASAKRRIDAARATGEEESGG